MISVVILTKNEDKNIIKIIRRVKKSNAKDILIVDGYSTDKTRELAEKEGVKVVLQSEHIYPGKGNAMRTGLEHAKGDIIVFLDGDIENFVPSWIDLLTEPIISGQVDICKAMYTRGPMDAPVTKLVAKPMLKLLFPDLNVKMPLEGEIAARKSTFEQLQFKEDWGVDIGLMLSAYEKGFNIRSIYLGDKIHKPSYIKDIGELAPMSEHVIRTILEYAHK